MTNDLTNKNTSNKSGDCGCAGKSSAMNDISKPKASQSDKSSAVKAPLK